MEVSMKYTLNPLAACFVPLSMKAHTGNINEDLHSIEFRKSIPFYKLKYEAPSIKSSTTNHSGIKNFDLISKRTTFKDNCLASKKSENAFVHAKVTPKTLIDDEASKDRSADRTSVEKLDLTEQCTTGNSSMELERTSDLANENTDPLEKERTSNMDEKMESVKMNWTSNMARENTDSGTVRDGNLYSRLSSNETLVDFDTKPSRNGSVSSTDSLQCTRSYQSDYGTDVENLEMEDCSDSPTEMLTDFKSLKTNDSGQENTLGLLSSVSEQDSYLKIKSMSTLSLYMTALLSSVLPSEDDKVNNSSKENLKARSKLAEKCICPPMFGWIIPFDYFGNPFNLNGACKKNYVHTTYKHAIYDRIATVQNNYRESLDFESHSVDSGHYSDDSGQENTLELLSSVSKQDSSPVEVNTLEECSLELRSIIKDVFECFDKLCEEKPRGDKNLKEWIAVGKEVSQSADSPLIDDGYHPLLEETNSEDDTNLGISVIEKFLGEALAFGSNKVTERHSSQSPCIPPCSVWCTNVPPSVIDTYKRFVKKIDSDPVNRSVADKLSRKPVYKRCFSANDTPKGFDGQILSLASSWELKVEKGFAAFKESKGTAHSNNDLMSSNFPSGEPTNPLKEGSDKWSLYDGADSLWQPLPDCVLSNDYSQKYAYKRGRIMRRQKSVG